MFTKTLKIIKNESIILNTRIMVILNKAHLFLPGDTFILFGSKDLEDDFNIPKRSEVYIDNLLVGLSGASGTMNVKSDQFTGTLHALYLN